MRVLMIDNYDSFTYNLVQLFYEFDLELLVFRNDRLAPDTIEDLAPDYICISPGPKDPTHAGISKDVVRRFGERIPVLGVCLGMQVINEVFQGCTRKAPVPVHGKTSMVRHTGQGVFDGIPSPFRVARYHSLCVDIASDELEVLAVADDGVVMAIRHRHWPVCGVQFHPESFMTDFGLELVGNFLAMGPAGKAQPLTESASTDRFPRSAAKWAQPREIIDRRVGAAS
ncbi:MAG: aminodeoxychorismate/anthranilate synthase component II [Thermodesulfobacteriota bacterium]